MPPDPPQRDKPVWPLEYQSRPIFVGRRWIVGAACLFAAVALLALGRVLWPEGSRGKTAVPPEASRELRAFEMYDRAVAEAMQVMPGDRVTARKMLEAAVAQAQAEHLLPERFFPGPSKGEEALLRLYLSDDAAGASPDERRRFIEHIRRSYPSFDLKSLTWVPGSQPSVNHVRGG